jgi:hypothetical protein
MREAMIFVNCPVCGARNDAAEGEHRALRETARALAQALRHVENVWCWWLEGGTSADAMEALIDMAKPLNNGGLLDSPAVRELLEPSESKHERE